MACNLNGPLLPFCRAPLWMSAVLFCSVLSGLRERINAENPPTSPSQISLTQPIQCGYRTAAKAGSSKVQRANLTSSPQCTWHNHGKHEHKQGESVKWWDKRVHDSNLILKVCNLIDYQGKGNEPPPKYSSGFNNLLHCRTCARETSQFYFKPGIYLFLLSLRLV